MLPQLANVRRITLVLASLLIVASASACSSSSDAAAAAPSGIETTDYCTVKSRCPNEPTPTSAQLEECHTTQSDAKCGPKLRVALDCGYRKETCLPDGTTDSLANVAACKAELDPWIACVSHP
jgi:hypothetical protein